MISPAAMSSMSVVSIRYRWHHCLTVSSKRRCCRSRSHGLTRPRRWRPCGHRSGWALVVGVTIVPFGTAARVDPQFDELMTPAQLHDARMLIPYAYELNAPPSAPHNRGASRRPRAVSGRAGPRCDRRHASGDDCPRAPEDPPRIRRGDPGRCRALLKVVYGIALVPGPSPIQALPRPRRSFSTASAGTD